MSKKYILGLFAAIIALATPTFAFAEISFVNSEQRTSFPTASSTVVFSYAASTMKDTGLVLNLVNNGSVPMSISYGAKLATLVTSYDDGAGNFFSTWRLEKPASGNNSIVVTGVAPETYLEVNILEYAGVDQKNMDGGHSLVFVPNGGTLTLSQSVTSSNAWVMSFARNQLYPVMIASTGVTTTRVSGTQSAVGDTNGPVGATGVYSMTWTSADATYKNYGIIMAISSSK